MCVDVGDVFYFVVGGYQVVMYRDCYFIVDGQCGLQQQIECLVDYVFGGIFDGYYVEIGGIGFGIVEYFIDGYVG